MQSVKLKKCTSLAHYTHREIYYKVRTEVQKHDEQVCASLPEQTESHDDRIDRLVEKGDKSKHVTDETDMNRLQRGANLAITGCRVAPPGEGQETTQRNAVQLQGL